MGIIPGITLNGSQPKKVMVEVEEDVNNKRWLLHTISSDVTWYHYPYPSKKNGASSFQFTCWINIYRYIRNKIRKSFDSSAWMSLWAPAGGGTHIVLNPIRQLMSRWEGVQNLCLSRQHFQKKTRPPKAGPTANKWKAASLQGSRKSTKTPTKIRKSMNYKLFTFKRYPVKSLTAIKSPSPTGRALQGGSSHKDNVSLQIKTQGEMYCRNFSEHAPMHFHSDSWAFRGGRKFRILRRVRLWAIYTLDRLRLWKCVQVLMQQPQRSFIIDLLAKERKLRNESGTLKLMY